MKESAVSTGPVRGELANDESPTTFRPLGGQFCAQPGTAIGAAPTPPSVIAVADQPGSVSDLDVDIQIAHTWVGDVTVTLSHGGITQILIDRPGHPVLPEGCPYNNIDATLADIGTGSVENACAQAPPAPAAISGVLTPSPGNLAAFNALPVNGDWTMQISDAFPASDDGVFSEWCLSFDVNGTGGGTGGTTTPATSIWGVSLLIALFLGASLFFLRRGGANA